MKTWIVRLLLGMALLMTAPGFAADLETVFRQPPAEARPWTYWFWMNGNITKEGITANLEAMARVGIKGVLIMEVANPRTMAPAGPVAFGGPEWRELFKFVLAEAKRLGLQVNMNNDAGWCGSGGPWITPELSMQKLVWTTATVSGPGRVESALRKPRIAPRLTGGYYRDLKVLAWPAELSKTGIPQEKVLDLTGKMDAGGKLAWDAPEGRWTIMRLGYTTTGRKNHPAPESGTGLECDKFNPEAMKVHFNGLVSKLADEAGADAGKILTMTHIDSWEVGVQDWTPRMAEEFRARRGYELTPWLAALAGGAVIGNEALTQRFLWDYKRTEAELVDAAYAGVLRELAHGRGLKLSIEAYNGGLTNPLTFGDEADLPMGEFWVARWGAWHILSPRLMASVGHASGKPVVGAESFTALGENDPFTEHPYSLKATGDWAFCEGINRFVFHRTALQPWTDKKPGMLFGPFGTHFDCTQTWWEQGKAFMDYLARCQALLQRGEFVADVCRLVPDGEYYGAPQQMEKLPGRYEPIPTGYNYDYVSDRAVLEGMTVKDGAIVTRGGMRYRVMQLPNDTVMTPELLGKLRELARGGAVIVGPRPERSPSLKNYPRCDQEVREVAAELWGDCDGVKVKEHALGAGRVCWGRPLAEMLRQASGGPDFAFVIDPPVTEEALLSITVGRGRVMGKEPYRMMPTAGLNWIHRRTDEGEIYFVANPQHRPVEALCTFRGMTGKAPELWDPATGEMRQPAAFLNRDEGVQMPLHFDAAGSVFVIFRGKANPATQIVKVTCDGEVLFGQGRRTPARLPELWIGKEGVSLSPRAQGRYDLIFADGNNHAFEVAAPPAALTVGGPWTVSFQPGRGAPERAEWARLTDWARHTEDGIRHFSGTATYATQFEWTPRGAGEEPVQWTLDLGEVQVIAEVRLNGKDCGVLWKPPFAVDVSGALRPGRNELEIKVTNLWPNRLIGDEQYPDDCTPDGSWTGGPIPAWPEWLTKKQPRPEARKVTFTTWKYYGKDSPLLASGLIGPVVVRGEEKIEILGHQGR